VRATQRVLGGSFLPGLNPADRRGLAGRHFVHRSGGRFVVSLSLLGLVIRVGVGVAWATMLRNHGDSPFALLQRKAKKH